MGRPGSTPPFIANVYDLKMSRVFAQNFLQFRVSNHADVVKNHALFNGEQALRADEAWLVELPAPEVRGVERDRGNVGAMATGDLAEDTVSRPRDRRALAPVGACRPSSPFAETELRQLRRLQVLPRSILFRRVPIARENRVTQNGTVKWLLRDSRL